MFLQRTTGFQDKVAKDEKNVQKSRHCLPNPLKDLCMSVKSGSQLIDTLHMLPRAT